MNPKFPPIDTDQVAKKVKLAGDQEAEATDQKPAPLRPELRKAFEDSWKRNEAAYRYLGQ